MNDTNQDSRSALLELTGLWENTDRRGNKYLSGNISGTVRVMIFKNNFKQNEREPDYRLYLTRRNFDDRGQGGQDGGSQANASQSAAQEGPQSAPDDDIPF